jgi:SAM-dependent methyltransferase
MLTVPIVPPTPVRAPEPVVLGRAKRIEHETEYARPGKTARLTLEYYNRHAEGSWKGTSARISRRYCDTLRVSRVPGYSIFGCGPGRDLKVFAELGHTAMGLEGAARFAVMARARSGCELWQQDFLKLVLSDSHFDGVFANAALFHVPSQELPRVLPELNSSLKPGGVLFGSNPRSHNNEGRTADPTACTTSGPNPAAWNPVAC